MRDGVVVVVEVGSDTQWNVRRFLFGIHLPKSVILTSANTADCCPLIPPPSFHRKTETDRHWEP